MSQAISAVFALLVMTSAASAGPMVNYEVKVTNLTRHQAWGKPVIVTHNSSAQIFRVGTAAGAGLTRLAEDGDNSLIATELQANPNVHAVVAGAAPIMPGATETYQICSSKDFPLVSVAGMLGTTNDTFGALQSFSLPYEQASAFGNAYDNGTERNNELCAFIPGTPCGMPFVRDPAGAEGSVQPSTGIRGDGDLDAATFGWEDPVIRVTITRMQ